MFYTVGRKPLCQQDRQLLPAIPNPTLLQWTCARQPLPTMLRPHTSYIQLQDPCVRQPLPAIRNPMCPTAGCLHARRPLPAVLEPHTFHIQMQTLVSGKPLVSCLNTRIHSAATFIQ
jgi:hypothetical protein